jgi:hypothetical protein
VNSDGSNATLTVSGTTIPVRIDPAAAISGI